MKVLRLWAFLLHLAVPKEMNKAMLGARPFDCKEEAISAILSFGKNKN